MGICQALFLAQLRARLHKCQPDSLHDLHRLDTTVWAAQMTGLKKVRDVREVQVLTKVLQKLNWGGSLPQALDILAQRIREVIQAKKAGSSWEKAQVLTFLPTDSAGSAPIPDGGMVL